MGSGGVLAAFGAERSPLHLLSTQNQSLTNTRETPCVCTLLSNALQAMPMKEPERAQC